MKGQKKGCVPEIAIAQKGQDRDVTWREDVDAGSALELETPRRRGFFDAAAFCDQTFARESVDGGDAVSEQSPNRTGPE